MAARMRGNFKENTSRFLHESVHPLRGAEAQEGFMKKLRTLGTIFAVLAAAAAVAAPASAVYDGNGNDIYIYQLPDGTLVY